MFDRDTPPAPKPSFVPDGIDLNRATPPLYMEDRDGNSIQPREEAGTPREIGAAAARTLNNAVDSATIATLGTVPLGWKQVDPHPQLAADFAKTGAMHLVSPDGTAFLAFPDAKVSRGEKIKQAFGFSSKAEAVNRIGRAFSDNTDITYAGHGRGGALAKLASESASTWVPNAGDSVRPKTCVAINSTAVPPATYAALGMARKNHARTTINIVNQQDAAARLKGFSASDQRRGGGDLAIRERSQFGRVVGGPRDGERRAGSYVGNSKEPKAYPDTLIKMDGDIRFAEQSSRIGLSGALRQLDGDIRHDLARKHLLAASRTPDLGKAHTQVRGGRE